MISSLISRLIILFFGTLYPAYASYKAVRTKNVKEYVKWMMYWIVFAFFTCIETFTDIFLAWFPFYYEIKVVIVLWLLSPATKGSSTLYRKFVHPMLTRREQEIDEYLNQARERGYSAVLQLGSKGVNYATNVIMQTAIKGGGNLVQTIKRSYSLSDLSEPDMHRTQDELDEVMASSTVMLRPQPTRLMRQRHQTPVGRSASGTRHSTGMYFTEVDVAGAGKQSGDFNYNIRSTDDISSGYSSAEPVSAPLGNVGVGLSRTSSMTNASKARVKSKRSEDKSMSASCTTLPRSNSSRKSDKSQALGATNQAKTRSKLDK
ncbi:receptor expression-enhancing protein 2 isoform X5 [Drosophila busckii]|uniref:receptor expression-enhancing protein 2 isoform X5 n=1 Tax=Drosophila busckii TaxID=30019 RepID=UPI00083F1996|nr:receptor expression-enhancing protein 2 isoform X5 [Drosophila busckii]